MTSGPRLQTNMDQRNIQEGSGTKADVEIF